MLVRTLSRLTSAWRRRSSGTRPMPASIAAFGSLGGIWMPAISHRAAVIGIDAEDAGGKLAAAGADQARHADDLAGAHLEGDVVQHVCRG